MVLTCLPKQGVAHIDPEPFSRHFVQVQQELTQLQEKRERCQPASNPSNPENARLLDLTSVHLLDLTSVRLLNLNNARKLKIHKKSTVYNSTLDSDHTCRAMVHGDYYVTFT